MSFFIKGFDNRGFYTINDTALAVVEAPADFIAVPWDISVPNIFYADFAITEAVDSWAGPLAVITLADMAVLGPVDDVWTSGVVVLVDVAITTLEPPDIAAFAVPLVTLTADFDTTEDDDFWGSDFVVSVDVALGATDRPDVFHGGAFIGYFFLGEQEVVYVKGEHTVMHVPANTSTTIRIAAKPEELGAPPVDTGMITKKRNRSRLQ